MSKGLPIYKMMTPGLTSDDEAMAPYFCYSLIKKGLREASCQFDMEGDTHARPPARPHARMHMYASQSLLFLLVLFIVILSLFIDV